MEVHPGRYYRLDLNDRALPQRNHCGILRHVVEHTNQRPEAEIMRDGDLSLPRALHQQGRRCSLRVHHDAALQCHYC